MLRRLALVAVLATLLAGWVAPPVSAEIDTVYGWDHRPASIRGTYQVITGQFGGDLATDILFYAPGPAPDSLWIGNGGQRGQAAFTQVTLSISGTYVPVVGDFGGDDYDDILFYGPGATADYLWISVDEAGYFDKTRRVRVSGSYQPKVVHDYRAEGAKDDILFLGPGPAKDYYWHFTDQSGTVGYLGPGTFSSRELTVNGSYQLVIGDYTGDGIDDVVLYQPGAAADYRWVSDAGGRFTQTGLRINGTYQPVVVYGERYDGILWWSSGPAPEAYWTSNGSTFTPRPVPTQSATGTAKTFGLGGALITSPAGPERFFYGTDAGGSFLDLASPAHDQSDAVAVIGNFDDDAGDYLDVLWYGPGTRPDELWYGIPASAAARASTSAGAGPEGAPPRQ